jgi:signal transduction histidine kinase
LLPKNQRANFFKVFSISAEGLYRTEKPETRAFSGTQGIARDITDWIELEDQFQQAQKMVAIGNLTGGIAHNFNNLLMGIQGNVSLALSDMDFRNPAYVRLKRIEAHIENGGDLTKQLLGFSRKGKYEAKPTNLNELIKTQISIFTRTEKDITFRGKYEKNLWPVEVDKGQIKQVLMNLYVNAWQAMPDGGELTIQTENVRLDEDFTKSFDLAPGKYVKISVTDTGIGMDKSTQQRIFDPFFSTKKMIRGTGLGLASVYGIIKNHQGFISVYSEKGEGTTFITYLPITDKEIVEDV